MPVNKRYIPRLSVKAWQNKGESMTAGAESSAVDGVSEKPARKEYFEVSVDARFQTHILAFDPATRRIVAAGAGLSFLSVVADVLGYLILRSGPRRVWFSVSEDKTPRQKGRDTRHRHRMLGGGRQQEEEGLVLTLPRQQYQTGLKTICEAARVA